ncbi:metallophosphoesterase [Marinobacter sp.]|uniref:metallophosphoesterase n=1 Tax=Marinobacter sp. TaxID=50741 RepID=UPI003A93A0C2
MVPKLTVHRFISHNPIGTDWLCGDMHGHYDALQRALHEVGFRPEQDRLFLLGDVIDRGPKSKELLNWVLATDYVQSVMGNHELMFVASSFNFRYQEKHRAIGGEWVDHIDFSEYRKLTTRCIQQLPLAITLACENGSIGLVHAQSPADSWPDVQNAVLSDRFAIDSTWPWNRAQGSDQTIAGVTAVASEHIGTAEVIQKGNQVWIDTLEQTGHMTLVRAEDIIGWVGS